MNIENFKARIKNKKVNSLLSNEQKKLVAELESKQQNVTAMSRTAGWKAVKEYMESVNDFYSKALAQSDPHDPISIIALQSEIRANNRLISFVESHTTQKS